MAEERVGNVEGVVVKALNCARNPSATTAHRLGAAKQCARLAGTAWPSALGDAWTIVRQLEPRSAGERRDRLRVAYTFELCLGDVRRAVELAEQGLAAESRQSNVREAVVAMLICGEAYVAAGRYPDARMVLRQAIAAGHELGLVDCLAVAFDWLVSASLEFDPPVVTHALLNEGKRALRGVLSGGSLAFAGALQSHEAQLAVIERRPEDALILAQPLSECLECGIPRWRARLLGIHLGARLLVGDCDSLAAIAAGMAPCFAQQSHWLDWPATIYARYLDQCSGRAAATAFASHFVQHIRRELFPAPPLLQSVMLGHSHSPTAGYHQAMV